jgi:hypothetical protein
MVRSHRSGPRDLAVVAHPAELAVDDLLHGDHVGTGAHAETQFRVAHLAAEADAVEPVREDDGPHALGLGPMVEHDVAVLGGRRKGRRREERGEDGEARERRDHGLAFGAAGT